MVVSRTFLLTFIVAYAKIKFKKFRPLYKKAAKKLAEHGISLAMCDAPKNKVIKEKYEMKEYPVMKWFRPDKSSDDY